MSRRSVLILTACVIALCAVVWVCVIEPNRRHLQFCRETRAEFELLVGKRPPTITRKQWQHVVAWTLNAHANCMFTRTIPQTDRDQFLTELRRRLQEPVDLTTVDWIWDELVRLTPNGGTYSDRYRPTTPERLREFEEGNVTWGIEVD
jgi:hypothetical protein